MPSTCDGCALPAGLPSLPARLVDGRGMLEAVTRRQRCRCRVEAPPPPPAAAACRRRVAAAAAAPPAGASTSGLPGMPPPPVITGTPNVVVLGGTGRVGSSTAAALAAAVPGARISLAGRGGDGEAFRAAVGRRSELGAAKPLRCDIDDPASLAAALKGADLVIHAAGPFQRRSDCDVLEAAIAAGVPYMDVCDDTDYSQRAKGLASKAAAAGVPAITTTGIYPGVQGCCKAAARLLRGCCGAGQAALLLPRRARAHTTQPRLGATSPALTSPHVPLPACLRALLPKQACQTSWRLT